MLLRSTLIYAPAVLFTRLAALLLLILATRLIDQTEYGLLTLVVTVGELVDVALANWLRIAFVRLGGTGAISRGSMGLAARVLTVTTAIAIVASVVASGFIEPTRWGEFSIAVAGYLVAGAVGRFALALLQMQQQRVRYAMMEFVRALLQVVLPVGLMLVSGPNFLGVSLASSLGGLVAGLAALVLAFRGIVAGPPRFSWRELLGLGVPLIVLALVGFGLNNAERVALKIYYDAGLVAVFAAAYALARQPIDMLANAINMGGFPELVSRFDRDGPAAASALLSELMALMLALCLPVAALLVALAPEICALVLPPDYAAGAARLFPLIALGVILANLRSFVFENVIYAHKRPWLLLWSAGPGSVVTIGLSILLIPPLAAEGAALALAGGALASLMVTIWLSAALSPVPVPWRRIVIAMGIALAAGGIARLVAAPLAELPVLLRLLIAGGAGGLTFLGLNALAFRDQSRQLLDRLLRRPRAA